MDQRKKCHHLNATRTMSYCPDCGSPNDFAGRLAQNVVWISVLLGTVVFWAWVAKAALT